MTAVAFNTHEEIQYLKNLGVNEKHAEGFVKLAAKAQGDLATKADLREVETKLEYQIKQVETKLEYQIDQIETKLENQIKQVETKLENKIDKEIGSVRLEMTNLKVELKGEMEGIKSELKTHFMYLYIIGTGILVTLLSSKLQTFINW